MYSPMFRLLWLGYRAFVHIIAIIKKQLTLYPKYLIFLSTKAMAHNIFEMSEGKENRIEVRERKGKDIGT